MFVPRALLEQVGGFDESFSMPGGGYANLELYERLGSSPDVTVVTILGEGSFHQVHGGTTTNQPDAAERRARVFGYSRALRRPARPAVPRPGQADPLRRPHLPDRRPRRTKPAPHVGARRSPTARRRRRRRPPDHADPGARRARGGRSPRPSGAASPWTQHHAGSAAARRRAPTDLLAYQEIIAEVRPDWIIETGTGDGGRALFLASICELVGHGAGALDRRRPRTTDRPSTRASLPRGRGPRRGRRSREVREIVGARPRARGPRLAAPTASRPCGEFEAYAPLVPVGSYVVVADTIVNGHPVWPGFGPGPARGREADPRPRTASFVADPTMEKYSLTFNPGGFLRRVS